MAEITGKQMKGRLLNLMFIDKGSVAQWNWNSAGDGF